MDVKLLRESFEAAVEANPNLVHDFYFGHLFKDHPELHSGKEALFPREMDGQEEALGAALVQAIENLEDPAWLEETLQELGRKHADLAVQPRMFSWVGRALLDTLAESDPGWNATRAAEWAGLYLVVEDLMLSGYPDTLPLSRRTAPKARRSTARHGG